MGGCTSAALTLAESHEQIQKYLIDEERRIAEAVAAEREACAELARRMDHESGYKIAAAIRARSKPEEKP